MKRSSVIGIIIAAVLVVGTALSMTGCITIQPGTIQPGDTASGAQQVTSQRITTSESGTIVDPSGAQITVPHGAVPKNSSGGDGEMLFAIKAGSVADFNLSGAPAYARVYEIGPSGSTFAKPVSITLPLPHGFNREKDLAIVCRYDNASQDWDVAGGRVNETGDAISVDVRHLSIFMPVIGGSIANLPVIGGSIANLPVIGGSIAKAPTIDGNIIDAPIVGGDNIALAPIIDGSIADVSIFQPGGPTGTATVMPTPTPTPHGQQQRLYPVADGDVYAYTYLNWNWANWGQWSVMGAGWNPTGGEKRSYLRFDVPASPSSSPAILKLYQYHMTGPVDTLGVYRVTTPWDEGTGIYHSGEVEPTAAPGELCWMQQPSFDPTPVAIFSSAATVPAWVEVDITSLVQQWQAGTPNYGLVIKTTNEHPTTEAMSAFYTKEESEQAHWPVLEMAKPK